MDQRIREVMTLDPKTVPATASVVEAARAMHENDIGDVIVLAEDRLYGILTDRDIVVRALAAGRDPVATRVADICSRELLAISPNRSVEDAARLMREMSIRRLPVMEKGGQVVGIVSLGDLAASQDRRSVLAEISVAPPNA
jgi:CBS domain-containing protein